MRTKPRIPEGGAIEDVSLMSMEEYSRIIRKKRGHEYVTFAKKLIGKTSPPLNSKVLEIGPGPGWGGIELLAMRTDLHLDGLEASPDMVRVATQNAKIEGHAKRAKYRVGTVEEMDGIPDNHYDLIMSRDSLHHWLEPEVAFRQMGRVLKNNGAIYIHDHKRDINLFGKLIVNIAGPLLAGKMAKHWKSSITAAYTKTEIESILAQVGLHDWQVETELLDLIIYKYRS